MASQGYPHQENNPPTYPQQPQPVHPDNFGFPQPPPAYDSGLSHSSGAYQQMQPIVTQPIIQPIFTAVGPEPSSLVCPSCRQYIITRLNYETTTKTHLMAGILCAFICWPCAWIPYVMDSCKNANHYCPKCGAFIGTYKS